MREDLGEFEGMEYYEEHQTTDLRKLYRYALEFTVAGAASSRPLPFASVLASPAPFSYSPHTAITTAIDVASRAGCGVSAPRSLHVGSGFALETSHSRRPTVWPPSVVLAAVYLWVEGR